MTRRLSWTTNFRKEVFPGINFTAGQHVRMIAFPSCFVSFSWHLLGRLGLTHKEASLGAIEGAVWNKDGICSQHSLHIQTNEGVRCRPLTFDSEHCSLNVSSSSHGVTKKINESSYDDVRICPQFVQFNTLSTASVSSCLLEMNHWPDGGTG